MPRAAWGQALGELRKLKHRNLSIYRYIETYHSLVQKSHIVAPELKYQWFIAGVAPGERQSGTTWAAAKESKGELVGPDIPVQYLRITERRDVIATAQAAKGEVVGEGKPDAEPMDVEAVAARARMGRSEGRRGATP